MPEKRIYRNRYKEIRNTLSIDVVQKKSRMICNKILSEDAYKTAEWIFGYYPLGNEVNCLEVLYEALKAGKKVALPKCREGSEMDFYEVKNFSELETGMFHIMEPTGAGKPILPSERKNTAGMVVLVPGVVFDKKGNRYGYGKGYYDAYLGRFKGLLKIAPAYELQLSPEELVCEETDVSVDWIITEEHIYSCEK